jgi:hypothetical protein
LVDLLNRDFADRGGAAGWDYRAGAELWERAPPFRYALPPMRAVLARQAWSLGVLAFWLVLSSGLAWRAAIRVRVL